MNYRESILKNADSEPKTITELMLGVGCWSSTDACDACEELKDEGAIRLVKSDGPFYQHKYFIRADG